jgi:hypothetical protein
VESHKWLDLRTRKSVSATQIIRHMDASPKNQDLNWIRERTTTKQ